MNLESLDPYIAPEPKEEPIRVAPEVEQKIKAEPVSDKLKERRLAAEMIRAYEQKNPGGQITGIRSRRVGEEEKKAA